jgi:hypothetical protein
MDMATGLKEFGATAKSLARNPLGIIALFIVLIYGFAALVVGMSSHLEAGEREPIIWFLVFFPCIVIIIFAWLVAYHHNKLYAPSDYKDDESFLRSINTAKNEISEIAGATIKIAYILADGSGRWGGMPDEHMNKIKEYEKNIEKYFSGDLHGEIKKALDDVNQSINSRIEKEKNANK